MNANEIAGMILLQIGAATAAAEAIKRIVRQGFSYRMAPWQVRVLTPLLACAFAVALNHAQLANTPWTVIVLGAIAAIPGSHLTHGLANSASYHGEARGRYGAQ